MSYRVWTLRLPWPSPPLRSNDHEHWRRRHAKTSGVRQGVALLVKNRKPLTTFPVVVTLIWTVTDRNRRDVGAGTPTLKAALDGLVDAGILPDDSWKFVCEERYRIEKGDEDAVRIEIEPLEATR